MTSVKNHYDTSESKLFDAANNNDQGDNQQALKPDFSPRFWLPLQRNPLYNIYDFVTKGQGELSLNKSLIHDEVNTKNQPPPFDHKKDCAVLLTRLIAPLDSKVASNAQNSSADQQNNFELLTWRNSPEAQAETPRRNPAVDRNSQRSINNPKTSTSVDLLIDNAHSSAVDKVAARNVNLKDSVADGESEHSPIRPHHDPESPPSPNDKMYWRNAAETFIKWKNNNVLDQAVSLNNLKHLRLLCELSREVARETLIQPSLPGTHKQIGIDWLRNSCENARQIFDAQSRSVTEELRRLVFLICYDLLNLLELEAEPVERLCSSSHEKVQRLYQRQLRNEGDILSGNLESRVIPLLLKSSKLFMFSDSVLLDCRPQMLGNYYASLARILLNNSGLLPGPMEQMTYLLQVTRVELTLSSSITMLPWATSCLTGIGQYRSNKQAEDQELLEFLSLSTETAQEKEKRLKFEDCIIRLVKETLGVRCYKYGSNLTEFTDKESDIDLGVDVNECEQSAKLASLLNNNSTPKTTSSTPPLAFPLPNYLNSCSLNMTTSLPLDRSLHDANSVETILFSAAPNRSRSGATSSTPSLPSKLARIFSHRLEDCFEFKNNTLGQEPRPSAKKPMVRIFTQQQDGDFTSANSLLSCLSADVSFSRGIPGLRNSCLLKHYCSLDSRVKPLVVLLKQWSRYRAVNGCYFGYLSSFAHTLTMIYFLQIINPPVLPNIQMPKPSSFSDYPVDFNKKSPTNSKGRTIDKDEENQSFILSSFKDEKLCEDHTVFEPTTAQRGVLNSLPWSSWKSRNTMTIRQLFKEYFRFMAIEFPSGGFIISPRVGPCLMPKISRFIANNCINAPLTVNSRNHEISAGGGSKKRRKKLKKAKGHNEEISSEPILVDTNFPSTTDHQCDKICDMDTTVDSQTTVSDSTSGTDGGASSETAHTGTETATPVQHQTIEYWINKHPDHTIQTYVQSKSEECFSSFERIMIEDPCENERILQPTRANCNEQLIVEYLRAWWFLEAGLSIYDLMKDLVPRRTNMDDPRPVDFKHMEKLSWYRATFSAKNPSDADVIKEVRHAIWSEFMTTFTAKLTNIDHSAPLHFTKLMSYYLCHGAFVRQWAKLLDNIEEDFTQRNLFRKDRSARFAAAAKQHH